MRIEAISICIGCHDLLQETAKWNMGLFDNWLIVTDPSDEQTREVCRRFNLRTLLSKDATKHPGEFAKGRLIERGLQHLSADAWRLHLDADIVFPHNFKQRLEAADLQEDMIYGFDRIMIKSWADWQKVQASGYLQGGQYDYHCRTNALKGFEIGTRWCHPTAGWVPIGWAQLFHSSQDEWRGVRVKPYPANHNTACRTDVQHALQWDRHKRALIPEVMAIHLESGNNPKGMDWQGRRSAPFGPTTINKPMISSGSG